MSAPVVILAGGTGGHIFPGLAVAAALQAHQVPVLWIGSRGRMETRLVPARDIPLEVIDISGVRGKGGMALLGAPLRIARAIWQSWQILRTARPRAVISFGGFVAGPAGVAAALRGIPLWVHEQNSRPGLTNRWLARWARQILQGFPGSFPENQSPITVGNPVRREIAALPVPAERLAGRQGAVRILVLGGSQGARSLNRSVPQVLAGMHVALDVRHQCGQEQVETVSAAYAGNGLDAQVEAFIDDMTAAWAWTDLVICRAGALTVAEVCAAGVASVLVPLPIAADDHQRFNAKYLVDQQAAEMVCEGELFEKELSEVVARLVNSADQRMQYAQAARALARTEAAEAVAQAVLMGGQQ